jgi:hypothetical protein
MHRRMTKLRGARFVLSVVALTWLPYTLTLCIPDVGTAGCTHGSVHEHGDARGVNQQSSRHHHDTPGQTCCEITGKRAALISPSPSLSPHWLVERSPASGGAATPRAPRGAFVTRLPSPAHGPPPYLEFHSLLI